MNSAVNTPSQVSFDCAATNAPATVLPSGGVSFDVEVQRPVGTDLVLVDPALQAGRSVSRADSPTPCMDASMMPAACALDVVVLDQFGRGINGEEVTFSVTRSIQVTDVLTPGSAQTIMVSTATSEPVSTGELQEAIAELAARRHYLDQLQQIGALQGMRSGA